MFRRKILHAVLRRGVCTEGEERTALKNILDAGLKDPSYVWVPPQPSCKTIKTWRDLEEEFSCAVIVRFALKKAPTRQELRRQSGDLVICRRGCTHPCFPPPCPDPQYRTFWETTLYNISRLIMLAMFLGLVYGSYGLKIWCTSSETLGSVFSDGEEKVDQIMELRKTTFKIWNSIVAKLFGVMNIVFPPVAIEEVVEEEELEDEEEFFMSIADEAKTLREKETTVNIRDPEAPLEEWDLIYNYKPEQDQPLCVETDFDKDWLWMPAEENYLIKPQGMVLPYESLARAIKKKKGLLASIYSDSCASWVTPEQEDTTMEECPQGKYLICKRREDRKKKVRNFDCSCPLIPKEEEEDECK